MALHVRFERVLLGEPADDAVVDLLQAIPIPRVDVFAGHDGGRGPIHDRVQADLQRRSSGRITQVVEYPVGLAVRPDAVGGRRTVVRDDAACGGAGAHA